MINIAGGGVRGMSCALYFLKNNHAVTIFESRQEIGNPVRSPGISKKLSSELIEKTSAKKTTFGWAFRREWYEKELAKKVTDSGGIIKLKTTAPEGSIDCTGGKSTAPGWPKKGTQFTTLQTWSGGITIEKNIPNEFIINSIKEDRFCFQRGDNLVECWIKGDLPRPPQGWLEIMKGEHPNSSTEIWVDEAIAEGEEIAKNIIHSLQELD
mgnify:FL=1